MARAHRLAAFAACPRPSTGFATILAFFLACLARAAAATSDPLIGVLAAEGGAGLGAAWRVEQSLYRDAGLRYDLVPLYLYEGKVLYMHAYRYGLKFDNRPERRIDVFLSHRFEGYPYDRIPSSLAGMAERAPGFDAGFGFARRGEWGALYGEYLHDVSGASQGTEMRLGYSVDLRSGRLRLRPSFLLSARDARLNDYYYGVRPDEATAGRPAFQPGPGVNSSLGLHARYDLTDRWRMLAGVSATRWSSGVRHSPIVDSRVQISAFLGLAYDFSREQEPWQERIPLIVKVMHGKSTDCNLVPVMRLSCMSTRTDDQTGITAAEIGRPFIERLNGMPLDFVGYLGVLRHRERGLQEDFWEVNAYMKAFYHGFPWSGRLRTRIGFGAGISYAQKVPFVERRDQLRRQRNTSKLLNYLDPSVDVNVGDLLRVRALRDTYFGFGVSHRSGIFGVSQLFGNVNGGSNYIYTYLEWRM